MRADDDTLTREERNRLHMKRVRAVHRRAAYARVSARIEYYRTLEREAAAGLRPALTTDATEHCKALLRLRDEIWSEMLAAGQVENNRP